MIIQPTSLAALTWLGAASGTTAESWRIGVVLSARPLGTTDQGKILLQVGGMTVEADMPGQSGGGGGAPADPRTPFLPGHAPTPSPLPAQFQVRVLSLGSQPTLEVMLPQATESTAQVALRERLPQQGGFAPLLATVQALAQRPVMRQIPAPLRPALAQLEQAMRTPADITTGAGLREAIVRSGLFMESSLAQGPLLASSVGEEDWKAVLLKLSSLLDSYAPPRSGVAQPGLPAMPGRGLDTPPPLLQRGVQPQARAADLANQLARLGAEEDPAPVLSQLHTAVRAALARVEVAQLEATTVPAWMTEIPIKGRDGKDVLQLQLDYVPGPQGEPPRQWTLGFAIDLPTLGPVQGELHLHDLRLSVRLWAERASTTDRLEQQFTALRQRLAACGLLLDQLSCQTGLPRGTGRRTANLLKAQA
ncbi:MAG: flagellar hook-length control protein FliK [Lysobacterales bacterium 14-68-21]|nr:MAG: flagellar hook-length control protein FliK [Xanthomonadales bacterium 15-68-25]OZB63706.1 MAG: flagellar hook-length control protein FliK [Xanthomonadales bacterium 14-68-21]